MSIVPDSIRPYFCYFCKGKARIFVSIQRAAIKQRVGSVGFYERYKLACERLRKTTLQAAWAAGIADVKCAFLITKISTRRQPLHAALPHLSCFQTRTIHELLTNYTRTIKPFYGQSRNTLRLYCPSLLYYIVDITTNL